MRAVALGPRSFTEEDHPMRRLACCSPLLCGLLAAVLFRTAPAADQKPADSPLAKAARKVREIIAHRGSSSDRPENTLASYRRAIEAGATVTETDMRTTKDGQLVSLHDANLSRTTNGTGLVSD